MWILLEGRPEMDGSLCGLIERILNTPSAYRNRKWWAKDDNEIDKLFVESREGCLGTTGGPGFAGVWPDGDERAE